VTDILDKIDAAASGLCACGCKRPVNPHGASAWFAEQACQQRWHERQAADPHDVYRRSDAATTFGTSARWVPPEVRELREAKAAVARRDRAGQRVARRLIRTGQTTTFDEVAVRAAIQQGVAAWTAFGEQLVELMAPLAAQLRAFAEQVQANWPADEPPSDPMERALYLRRNRNTGPKQQSRAPRRLDARGCR